MKPEPPMSTFRDDPALPVNAALLARLGPDAFGGKYLAVGVVFLKSGSGTKQEVLFHTQAHVDECRFLLISQAPSHLFG